MTDITFPYPRKRRPGLLGAAFFAVCALVIGQDLMGPSKSFTALGGLINFGPQLSYGILAALTAASVIFVVLGLWIALAPQPNALPIRITDTTLEVPHRPGSDRAMTIPLNTITGLSQSNISGQRFVYVDHLGGRAHIVANALPRKSDQADLVATLDQRLRPRER